VTASPTTLPSPTPAPTPSDEPLATLATGYIAQPEYGFAITLVDGWQAVPLDPVALQKVIGTLSGSSPLVGIIQSQAASAAVEHIKFWALDFRPASVGAGFAPNLNVLLGGTTALDLQTITQVDASQLKAAGVTVLKSVIATLPATKAGKVTYKVSLKLTNGTSISVLGTQYIVFGSSGLLVFTFSCSGIHPGTCPADSDATIKSLMLIP
jgi:hypothetical protein